MKERVKKEKRHLKLGRFQDQLLEQQQNRSPHKSYLFMGYKAGIVGA